MMRLTLPATLFALSAPALAAAGGLEVGERTPLGLARGGAVAASVRDPSAVDLNPGALARLKGAHAFYSHEVTWQRVRFERARSAIPQDANVAPSVDPYAPVSEQGDPFALGAMVAASHDLGLRDWVFALSLYGPHGVAAQAWPRAGGQRWLTTGYDGVILFPGVSAAWGGPRFGVGITAQAATMPRLNYRLVVDGSTGSGLAPLASAAEVEAELRVRDPFAPTALVGAWVQATPWLDLALSGRAMPVVFDASGDFVLRNVPGQGAFTPEQLTVPGAAARTRLTLPATARVAARVHDPAPAPEAERWDVELQGQWAGWSTMNQQRLALDGEIRLFGAEPVPDVVLPRRWRDTLGLSLGGSFSPLPGRLRLHAGASVERGATPPRYAHIDFVSFDRLGLGLGAEGTFHVASAALRLAVGYARVLQPDQVTAEQDAKVPQQRPLAPCPSECDGRDAPAVNAGRIESGFDLLGVSLHAAF
jgi:long-subunit fatty acid transport protein